MPSVIPIVAGATLGLAATAGLLAYGVSGAQSQLFGPTLVAPPRPNQIALTFDDGPNPAATPELLEVLARHGVQATFFLIGSYVLREPGLAREIAARGHVIGNHTMTHRFLPCLSTRRIRAELAGCSAAIEQTLGRRVELFRPPHGGRSPAVFHVARELGLKTVQWNVIVGDWKPLGANEILARLERSIAGNRRAGRGTNLVLHDGGQAGLNEPRMDTVFAVDRLLSSLRGVEFVAPPDWTAANIWPDRIPGACT